MAEDKNVTYREAAEGFARRVVSELGDQIDSIVLYGSVARREALEESDIDILVIFPDGKATRDRLRQIERECPSEGAYDRIEMVGLSRDEFSDRVTHGYPFIAAVFKDGVVLHDNDTFSRIRGTPMSPSLEYMRRQLQSTEEALSDARFNLDGSRWRTGANRAYYAMFHAALAALAAAKLKMPRSHRGAAVLFERHVIGTGQLAPRFGTMLQHAQNLRWEADYDVEGTVSESQAREVVENADEFVAEVKKLLEKQDSA